MAESFVFVKRENRYVKVPVESILYLSAAGSYLRLHTAGEAYTISQNLSQFLRNHPISSLVRVHRSFLVNASRVDSFDHTFVYIGEHRVPIGDSYRHQLMETLRSI